FLANLFKLISPSSYSFITFFFNSKLYFFIAASFLATTFGESYTCGTFPWLSPFGEVISLMTIIYYEMTLRRKILYNNIILDNKTQISSILIKEVLREMLPKLI
ncbi:hypothetical protein NH288_03650, partial [Anaerococcus sp. NML200537]|uniref:hypothetical protein n=1 Tax=Anaerococcus sp. NML200537 TaxID=2954485 RepID=UPI0022388F5F